MEVKITFYWLFIIVFLHLLKCVNVNKEFLMKKMRIARKAVFQPTFDERMPLRIRVIDGAVAFLTCIVKNLGNESVSWIRNQDLQILTVNDYVFTGDSRFHIIQENLEKWTLKINDVRLEDNGIYECQISTQPVTSYSVYLSVSDKYDWSHSTKNKEREQSRHYDLINDDVAKASTTQHQNSLSWSTRITEGREISIIAGSPLRLTCEVPFSADKIELTTKTEEVNVIFSNLVWFHDNKILNRNSSHEGTIIKTIISSNVIRSRLIILRTFTNDSGEYICHPFTLSEAVIIVHITNGKAKIQTLSLSALLISAFVIHKIVKKQLIL